VDWTVNDHSYACLKVMDSGCGIQPTDFDNLFEPFFSTKSVGRGLGLPVVLGIVRAHKGGVTVDDRNGGGSVFSVFFPLSAQTEPQQMGHVVMGGPGSGGTVLLVEDDDLVRDMTSRQLRRQGYTVLQAQDGIEAVEIFRQHKDEISCLLSDLIMPRMDGWATIAALRAIRHDLPVVLASGYDEASVMAGEHAELPELFLSKPYNFHELDERIGCAIARRKARV
jgi:CheY-like chemotaxis protein